MGGGGDGNLKNAQTVFSTQHTNTDKVILEARYGYLEAGTILERGASSLHVSCPISTFPVFKIYIFLTFSSGGGGGLKPLARKGNFLVHNSACERNERAKI